MDRSRFSSTINLLRSYPQYGVTFDGYKSFFVNKKKILEMDNEVKTNINQLQSATKNIYYKASNNGTAPVFAVPPLLNQMLRDRESTTEPLNDNEIHGSGKKYKKSAEPAPKKSNRKRFYYL